MKSTLLLILKNVLILSLFASALNLRAQGTAFTYQGLLDVSNSPATGSYDLTFALFNNSNGVSGQVGLTQTNLGVDVSNGLFSVTLNFGAVFNGSNYWVEIAARTNNGAAFTNLSPLLPINPAPYAIYAGTASNALTATALSGTVSNGNISGTYTNLVTFSNAGNVFYGSGAGLTNVTASTVGGVGATNLWLLNGNAGTTPGAQFLGTTDNNALELHVNGARALRLEPNAGGPNVIGGSSSNSVAAGDYGATIGGGAGNSIGTNSYYSIIAGGDYNTIQSNAYESTIAGGGSADVAANIIETGANDSFIGSGSGNTIGTNSYESVVVGGTYNYISNDVDASITGGQNNTILSGEGNSFIGGGYANTAGGTVAVIGGGLNNSATGPGAFIGGGGYDGENFGGNTAGGNASVVGGGFTNTSSGQYAVVPGGFGNLASGDFSFAAGNQAQATNQGAFVWADSQETNFASTNNDSFNVRAQGGVNFVTSGTGLSVDGPVTAASFSGSGAGLTSLNGADLAAGSVGRTQLTDGTLAAPTNVSDTNLIAEVNTSYLVTNSAATTIDLPTNASIGDEIQITGAGAGGWTAWGGLAAWTQSGAPSKQWESVASSSDGTHLAAVVYQGGIYTSADSGTTWLELTPAPTNGQWYSVASSSDGTHLAAVDYGVGIYISADSGVTWTLSQAPSEDWFSVASSSDGSHLVAAVFNGGIYTSTDFGADWTEQTSAPDYLYWRSVASSSDGIHLVAAAYDGGIYTSADSGVTWGLSGAPDSLWISVASSSDGTHLVAAVYFGGIYTSSDSGADWTQTGATNAEWISVASSSDGTDLVAGIYQGGLYTSTNSGVEWTEQTSAPTNAIWNSVAESSDGSRLAAVAQGGGIYTYSSGPIASGTQGGTAVLQYLGNGQWGEMTITAAGFVGDGSGLTGLNGANLAAGTVGASQLAAGAVGTAQLAEGTLAPPASVSSATFNALANTSYVVTNAGPAAIELPTNANIGDVVQITGAGTGAWAANEQTVWTRSGAPSETWYSVASSSDGSHLVAVALEGGIYTSTNFGATWTEQTSSPTRGFWVSVASSSDGSHLVAAAEDGAIYTSVNFGVTWTERPSAPTAAVWYPVVSSSDGSHLAAAVQYGGIYTSADYGTNWGQTSAPTSANWFALASSSDGSHLVGAANDGGIYTTTDSGATWTEQTSAPTSADWTAVASSADGANLVGLVEDGGVYTSTNSGTNWTEQTSAPAGVEWQCVASSSDGTRLVAGVSGGGLYISTDSGTNWTEQISAFTSASWYSVASSSDGTRLAAVAYNNGIFTYFFDTVASGTQGGTALLQYLGNGQWGAVSLPQSTADVPDTAVTRDASGNFSAGTITATAFVGSGAGLTNLPSWSLTGNAGTTAGVNFVGTTDNQPLQIWSHGKPALVLDGTTDSNQPNVIGGSFSNSVASGVYGATIAGGVDNVISNSYAAVGGGTRNTASGIGSFIGGGGFDGVNAEGNTVSAPASVVGGGLNNSILLNAVYSTIGGGNGNTITNSASSCTIAGGNQNTIALNSTCSTIGGGGVNTITNAAYAVIPGGRNNFASGNYSFAAGQQARATNQGAFVWADSQNTNFASTNNDSFNIRAQGGVIIYDNLGATAGVFLASNSTAWATISDRNAKKNFQPVDTIGILDKLAAIPVQQWNYKWEKDSEVPNIGPMAQDFKGAFYPGRNDTSITTLEFDGVELAAIQGLNQKVESNDQKLEAELKARDAKIASLEREIADLKSAAQKTDSAWAARFQKLEKAVASMTGGNNPTLAANSAVRDRE